MQGIAGAGGVAVGGDAALPGETLPGAAQDPHSVHWLVSVQASQVPLLHTLPPEHSVLVVQPPRRPGAAVRGAPELELDDDEEEEDDEEELQLEKLECEPEDPLDVEPVTESAVPAVAWPVPPLLALFAVTFRTTAPGRCEHEYGTQPKCGDSHRYPLGRRFFERRRVACGL